LVLCRDYVKLNLDKVFEGSLNFDLERV
jgi:hypothetical protein